MGLTGSSCMVIDYHSNEDKLTKSKDNHFVYLFQLLLTDKITTPHDHDHDAPVKEIVHCA